jgi:hypothetical protein
MWVIDIQHRLDETQTGPAVPQLKSKVKKITEIITFATSIGSGISIDSQPNSLNAGGDQKGGPARECWIFN